jgi:hypothetical protein
VRVIVGVGANLEALKNRGNPYLVLGEFDLKAIA